MLGWAKPLYLFDDGGEELLGGQILFCPESLDEPFFAELFVGFVEGLGYAVGVKGQMSPGASWHSTMASPSPRRGPRTVPVECELTFEAFRCGRSRMARRDVRSWRSAVGASGRRIRRRRRWRRRCGWCFRKEMRLTEGGRLGLLRGRGRTGCGGWPGGSP